MPSQACVVGRLVADPLDHRQRPVDRDREADVLGLGEPDAGGVDPDEAAEPVDERPAGVAGVDRGVRLQQAGQLAVACRRSCGRARRRSPRSRSARRARAGSRRRRRRRRAAATRSARGGAGSGRSRRRGSRRGRARAPSRSRCPASGRVCRSSLKTTVTLVVPSTTWLFVTMIPARSSTTPEPSPSPPPNDFVRTLTTDGSTRSTTSASDPAVEASGAVSVTAPASSRSRSASRSRPVPASSSPPLQPARSSAASASATSLTEASGT